jgi:hypothetical protein
MEEKISPISIMSDTERKAYFENHKTQVANALEIMDYLERTKYTKVWHEQLDYIMNNFLITNKNK